MKRRRANGEIDGRSQASRERWDTGEPYRPEFIAPLMDKAWNDWVREISLAKQEMATAPLYRRWPDGV